MLSVQNISFRYRDTPLFSDFTWHAQEAETWAILGPSGCGKTTLLYLLAGLLQPLQGTISVQGQELIRPRPKTGLILQDYGLLPWATIRDNVSLGINIRSFYGPDGTHAPADDQTESQEQSVGYWMDRLNLTKVENHYPATASGGQRQRAAIARTLVLEPDLLLMDEPFASLDAPTRESLQELILDLQAEQQMTIIAVTHTIEEAAFLGNQIMVLGQPPHTKPRVYDNPEAGTRGYRGSPAYQSTCSRLREMLEGSQ